MRSPGFRFSRFRTLAGITSWPLLESRAVLMDHFSSYTSRITCLTKVQQDGGIGGKYAGPIAAEPDRASRNERSFLAIFWQGVGRGELFGQNRSPSFRLQTP